MSASTTPTDSPSAAIAAARLTVTDDLPDAALAGRDREDAGEGVGAGEGDLALGLTAAQPLRHRLALLVAHDVERRRPRR